MHCAWSRPLFLDTLAGFPRKIWPLEMPPPCELHDIRYREGGAAARQRKIDPRGNGRGHRYAARWRANVDHTRLSLTRAPLQGVSTALPMCRQLLFLFLVSISNYKTIAFRDAPIAQFSKLMFAFLMMSACNAKRSASSAANCPGDEVNGTSAWLSSFS